MRVEWVWIVAIFTTLYIIDSAWSQNSSQNGNPSSNNDITSASDTTNNVDSVNNPSDVIPASGNGQNGPANSGKKPKQTNKRLRARRLRQRRRRIRQRKKIRKRKTTTPPPPDTTTRLVQKSVDSFLSDTGFNDVGTKGESAAFLTGENIIDSNKPGKQSSAESDSFFDLFETAFTTTLGPDSNAPPPKFDPNAKPGQNKQMPTVDPSKSKTYDGRPCNETYKPHQNITTKYMMQSAEGVWESLDCPPNLGTGLVWRQDLCLCGEELTPQDPNDECGLMGYNPIKDNKHKYIRRHNGAEATMECAANLVWSQAQCECTYDITGVDRPIAGQPVMFVCKTILHLEFEGDLNNAADGYLIQAVRLRRRGRLPRIRFMKTRGSRGKAAMIVSQPLEFQPFRGNDFQTQVTYSVNFKLSPRHRNRKNFMTLLTDECIGNYGTKKERKPSFSLTFQPFSKTFRLQFRTERAEIDELSKRAQPDGDDWYKVVVYFEDATVNLENNGVNLMKMTDIYGKIPQNKCPLYIAGRGPGFDRSQDFYGYMDNVFLVKDCKFHEANIKLLK